ncbi:MAG: DUF4339 domain-containing protein [Pirellulaceae bacterium]|nr:DUF4339 domain-containing protein [Pirellulaceae bacterium]
MNEIEWYYAHDERQFGPVSTAELKRLADRGDLTPGDLVWRQGIPDWVEASQVKGLFHANAPAATPNPGATVPSNPGPTIQPVAGPAAVRTESVDRAASAALRHPVEVVLSAARRSATRAFADSTIRLFAAAGHYALYAAMLLVFMAGAAISAHQKSATAVLYALAAVPVLAVLQYAASQFGAALARVNQSTRAMVASTTLLDLLGLTSMVAGLILLLALATVAITSQAYALVLTALLAFIVCQHLAAVSFIHVDDNVVVSNELSPGEEALGTLIALLKASARVVPVAFGAGVVGSAIMLVAACVYCVRGGESLPIGIVTLVTHTAVLITYAALPIVGYLVFLLLALLFDILDGLLTLRHPREE